VPTRKAPATVPPPSVDIPRPDPANGTPSTCRRGCAQAPAELAGTLPLDAATLLTRDPVTGGHVQLAGIGYTAGVSQSLAEEFVATPWYRDVVRQALPPSISQDADGAFRQGRFYAERVRPAGFRHEERLVGLVHLSAVDAHAYGTDARRLLASLMPALADPRPRTGELLEPQECAAALVTDAGVVGIPGRERVQALDDEEFRALVRAFADSGGRRLRLLWPWGACAAASSCTGTARPGRTRCSWPRRRGTRRTG